jgi:acyl carrier protein
LRTIGGSAIVSSTLKGDPGSTGRLPDDEEILDGIAAVARQHLDWNGDITREMPLVETFGLDSVKQLVLLVELEDRFRVRLDERDEAGVQTVGDLVDLIRRKRGEATPDAR